MKDFLKLRGVVRRGSVVDLLSLCNNLIALAKQLLNWCREARQPNSPVTGFVHVGVGGPLLFDGQHKLFCQTLQKIDGLPRGGWILLFLSLEKICQPTETYQTYI